MSKSRNIFKFLVQGYKLLPKRLESSTPWQQCIHIHIHIVSMNSCQMGGLIFKYKKGNFNLIRDPHRASHCAHVLNPIHFGILPNQLVNLSTQIFLWSGCWYEENRLMWNLKKQEEWINITKQKQGCSKQTGGCWRGGWGKERNRWGRLRGINFELQDNWFTSMNYTA